MLSDLEINIIWFDVSSLSWLWQQLLCNYFTLISSGPIFPLGTPLSLKIYQNSIWYLFGSPLFTTNKIGRLLLGGNMGLLTPHKGSIYDICLSLLKYPNNMKSKTSFSQRACHRIYIYTYINPIPFLSVTIVVRLSIPDSWTCARYQSRMSGTKVQWGWGIFIRSFLVWYMWSNFIGLGPSHHTLHPTPCTLLMTLFYILKCF